jgi:hypothetical protein
MHDVPKLTISALRDEYRSLYGRPARRAQSQEFLQATVTSRLQRLLLSRLRSKTIQALTAAEAIISILSTNSASTEFVREWNGKVWAVTLDRGEVFFGGRRFKSLSSVAHLITGKRCSGPAFFRVAPPSAGKDDGKR